MDKVNEAISILSGFIGDFCTPIEVIKDYENDFKFREKDSEIFRQCLYRLCFQSLILNMAKYLEFCTKYSATIFKYAPQYSSLMDRYKKEINQKDVKSFRNHHVGHIQVQAEKRVLTNEEVTKYIEKIVGKDAYPFFEWICPENYTQTNPEESLVGVITMMRDELRKVSNSSVTADNVL